MKKYLYSFYLIAGLSLLLACNSKPEKEGEKDRNMLGKYIPRGLTIHTEGLTPGYVLFSPTHSPFFYLLNRKGEVVHEWKGNYEVNSGYLQDDGSIYLNAIDPDFPTFYGGGNAGRLQRITWEGKLEWDFEYADAKKHVHHDLAVLPNGNILSIAWEEKTYEEAIAAGRKPELTPKGGIWPDKIIEVKPDGKYGGEIVWEWRFWDHMIQDYDESKSNFGDPAAHPELLDMNIGKPVPESISEDSLDILFKKGKLRKNQTADNEGADIYHCNAINYNAELDQIVISSQRISEIFIIDHSTTTAEAAGHTGGRWGKGGDFLYRWGNSANYRQGDSTDQQLFGQHDIRWIEEGLPGEGHLTLYNNNIPNGPDSLEYSAIFELDPPRDENGNYAMIENNRFGPQKPLWTYTAPDTISFWGSFVSGAQRMENGNTFINEGPKARFFEVTPEREIVWEYLSQYRGNIHKTNGDPIPFDNPYWDFRSNFIPSDHPALAGKELKPLDPQPPIFKLPAPKPK